MIKLNSIFQTFKDKKVLITGHTGFKGSWLSIWLKELGADVIGYALVPYTRRDNFVVTGLKDKMTHIVADIRNFKKIMNVFEEYQPEFVFHLAAQPLVRKSYTNPKETFEINIGGTVNILECCRLSDSVRVIINVTSDKCYENMECVWGYRESDPLGGFDPYSSSKGCSELVTAAYRQSFFNPGEIKVHKKSISSVRAGNVIGGGDRQKDRIIPDCIHALENNQIIEIRNPTATRPWQHVLDPLAGYLLLAVKMREVPEKFYGSWNFGPNHESSITVGKIADLVVSEWGAGQWETRSGNNDVHEANLLNLDISKARSYLNWRPVWDVEKAVQETIDWYKKYKQNDPYQICIKQIEEYVAESNCFSA